MDVTLPMLINMTAATLTALADSIFADDADLSGRVSDMAQRRRQWATALQSRKLDPAHVMDVDDAAIREAHGEHDPAAALDVLRTIDDLIATKASAEARTGMDCDWDELNALPELLAERRDRRQTRGPFRCQQCGAWFEKPRDNCPECEATENYHVPM